MNSEMINRYIKVVDEISLKYKYTDNIKHLLYIIVPAFIIKYGFKKEHFIIDCLNNIPIIITGKEDPLVQAMYISYPYYDGNIKTKKNILLNRYNNIPFMQLIDNLIHELNHAINSYKNEIIVEKDTFYLRTGLSKVKYDRKTFKIIDRTKSYILEEIINSKQTEEIINIIMELSKLNIDNIEIQNTLYAVKSSVQDKYISDSYYGLKYYCQTLLNNKTFLLTLENLRIDGNIDDIGSWFNNIYGDNNGYKNLIESLYKLKRIQNKKVLFKKQKMKDLAIELINISNRFNDNCNLK